MSSYDLDKRFPISLVGTMYAPSNFSTPGSQPSALPLYSESNAPWPNDSMGGNDYPSRRWTESRAAPSPDMHFQRYQQASVSGVRTTIPELDSPAFQPLSLLPTEVMMQNHSRIPRGVPTYMDSPSTDPGELSDHSSPGWENWNTFPFDGRPTPSVKVSRSSTSSPDWPSALNVSVPPYDSTWQIMPGPDSSVTPYTPQHQQQNMLLNGLMFPNRFSPLPESPSPPPMYQDSVHTHPSPSSTHAHRAHNNSSGASRGSAAALDPNVKRCSHCKATQTPLWRRDPSTFKPLCNACGLYLQQRNRLRPQVLIDADADDGDTTDEMADINYTGPKCSHCGTHQTSVWRRSKTGAQLCNACGVYARLRGKPRPLSLKRNKIKPRSKHPKP